LAAHHRVKETDMGFGEAVRTCWSKYGDIDGRAPRSEFWWWVVFAVIVQGAAGIALGILLALFQNVGVLQWIASIAFVVVVLALILPSITVAIRRLHDRGLSGWWYLLNLIPIGNIVILVFYLLPGDPGTNKFGDAV
jgi:uncharacterized membrane protein YhaH (DUF805 family)